MNLRRHPLSFCFAICLGCLATVAQAQRDLTDIPEPDPVAEAAAMKLDSGAAVNLFAADPAIRKPIQMNFDCTGALWVASSKSYPQVKPGEIPNDQIVVLRDLDNDGVAESSTVFADGLLIPTGVIPDGPHAAYVAASTELLYFEDTDHDGVADERRIVLSGFGTEDTHHLVHTLRWGPDGCLYFNQSIYIHSHIDTPDGTKRLDGGGIWRYRPSTGQLDVFCKGFINPWGHIVDTNGESFVSDGAAFDGITYAFPDAVFKTSPGATRWLLGLNPGSPKYCGLEVLSGSHIPPEWKGDLITNDFRSHRVCRFSIRPNGADYISRQQPEPLTTEHVAFRPIDARMAPDGTLMIADWYNPIIQHGEVDFRDPRRDTEHGRIWRLSFPDRPLDPWPDFLAAKTPELLSYLEDESLTVRQFARRTLWDHLDEPSFFDEVNNWVHSGQDGLAHRQLEAQWLREAAFQPIETETAIAQLNAWKADPTSVPDNARAWLRSQFRSAEQTKVTDPANASKVMADAASLVEAAIDIADPALTLEVVVQCGQLDSEESAVWLHRILSRLLASDQPLSSQASLDFALWQSIRETAEHWQRGNETLQEIWEESPKTLAWSVGAVGSADAAKLLISRVEWDAPTSKAADDQWLSAIGEVATAEQLGSVLSRLLTGDSEQVERRISTLLASTSKRNNAAPADADSSVKQWLGKQKNEDLTASTLRWISQSTQQWKLKSTEGVLLSAIETRSDASAADRQIWINALASLPSPKANQTLMSIAKEGPVADRLAAIDGLVASRPGAAVPLVLRSLSKPDMSEAAHGWLVSALSRPDLVKRYTEKMNETELPSDTARTLLRAIRSAGGNAGLEQAIRKSGKLADATWELSPELKTRLLKRVQESGSATRGELVYRRKELQCIACHAIGTAGGLVGPNLVSLGGSSQPDYVLESLLDPSARLKEGYSTRKILTEDGEVISGIAIGQTEDATRLRLADGTEREIETDAILDDAPGKSLMPEGLLDNLTEAELVDLTTFLVALGRDPEFTVSTQNIVRSFETLTYTAEANRRLNRTSVDTAAQDDPAMTWRDLTSMVDGTVRLEEADKFKQHRQSPHISFLRFDIEVTPSDSNSEIATIALKLLGATPSAGDANSWDGFEAWVDGKPTPTWQLKNLPLSRGRHRITLSINRDEVMTAFGITLEGDANAASKN
ncbi:PVC-type heme-binding CxxCH protein [Rhodopirellula bahusiensis]|uniref:L-sorbosone dehydrogenase n=2 Tax=Rhodopirellula bahusiensis TaxID=2014065 RepID=A0A2G1WA50_9BACT|nr:PVC-type heme-binding CxxCH protein [Rhodopirellula bahusiensis]PHQ35891.1 L-sorbosone dehydrogenase [Rhodopirellula bahusiensis]